MKRDVTVFFLLLGVPVLLIALVFFARPGQVQCTFSPPVEVPGHTWTPEARAQLDAAYREAADGWCPAP